MINEEEKKVFYFLKLQRDFFHRSEIRILEAMPNGKEYAYFYLKLMVESLAENGYLRTAHMIAYDVNMLAAITNTNVDVARVALEVLTNMGLLEIVDNFYYIPEVAKITGKLIDSPAAIRKRRQREREAEEAARLEAMHVDDFHALTSGEQGKRESVTNCHASVTDMSRESVTNCHENIRSIEDKKNRKIEEEEKQHNTISVEPARAHEREEVEQYIAENCPHIINMGFYDYYNKRQWQINGKPITDWRALAMTWEENMQKEAQRIPIEEERELWRKYEKQFGHKVPVEYYGTKYKYVKLALATGVPLEVNT